MLSRRVLMKNGGLALLSLGFAPSFLARTLAAEGRGGKILITIFQRGAVDGLNMVVPFGDDAYYSARPSIAIRRPGRGADSAIDLDGFLDCIPGWRHYTHGSNAGSLRSCTPPAPTRAPDHTSMHRTTWRAAPLVARGRTTGGSIATYRRGGTRSPQPSEPWRSLNNCPGRCRGCTGACDQPAEQFRDPCWARDQDARSGLLRQNTPRLQTRSSVAPGKRRLMP